MGEGMIKTDATGTSFQVEDKTLWEDNVHPTPKGGEVHFRSVIKAFQARYVNGGGSPGFVQQSGPGVVQQSGPPEPDYSNFGVPQATSSGPDYSMFGVAPGSGGPDYSMFGMNPNASFQQWQGNNGGRSQPY